MADEKQHPLSQEALEARQDALDEEAARRSGLAVAVAALGVRLEQLEETVRKLELRVRELEDDEEREESELEVRVRELERSANPMREIAAERIDAFNAAAGEYERIRNTPARELTPAELERRYKKFPGLRRKAEAERRAALEGGTTSTVGKGPDGASKPNER